MLFFVLLPLALGFVLFIALRRRPQAVPDAPGADMAWPFYARKPLSEPEQVLYHRLVAAMPECIVLAQVQLSRVLGVRHGANLYEWNNRINRMSLDYLVCLKDATIVAAIELDDRTHDLAARIGADTKKEKALAAAGIPLIRWHVGALPDESAIRMALAY